MGKTLAYLDKWFHIRQLSLFFAFSLVLSFLIFYEVEFLPNLNVGDVAKFDIRSRYSFQFSDEISTEIKKKEAAIRSPLVFDYDDKIYEKNYENIYKTFNVFRKKTSQIKWPRSQRLRAEKVKNFLSEKNAFDIALGRSTSAPLFEWLTEKRFSVSIENAVISQLEAWSEFTIESRALVIEENEANYVILRDVYSLEESNVLRNHILDIKKDINKFKLVKSSKTKFLSKSDQKRALSLARLLIVPNITVNKKETLVRQDQARSSVPENKIQINKNQVIVKSGTKIQPSHYAVFNEMKKIKAQRNFGVFSILAALLLTGFLLGFASYLKRFTKVSFTKKDVILMSLLSVISVLFMNFFWSLSNLLELDESLFFSSEFFYYLAPLSFPSLLLGMLIVSGELVWVFTFFVSLLYAMIFDFEMPYFLFALLGGLVAVRYVCVFRKRSDIYLAGLRVGLVNVFLVFIFLSWNSWGQEIFWEKFFWHGLAGLGGGLSSAFLAMMFIPLLENIFNYTTDMKLLELSNLSHPLLQNLFVKAPGTYHHSMVVGSMVEVAAERIGCNPLLAKVMAYYHDIGKAQHPEYFIENQRGAYNPHNEISPYMSRTVLIAHVKDGVEMGVKHNLGNYIIDGILQHHGTTTISYFYNKALNEDHDKSDVNEEEFRYPGPKPQFREAALVMLGDSIEAAARSLKEPTTVRLQNIVHNVIREKFLDNQLDQCDLTLKDLSIIEEAFEQVILGIHHQRIEYPS